MPTTHVEVEVSSGVARVTLNRPESANAIDMVTAAELHDVVRDLAADDSVRSVMLRGSGRRFCAGGDVSSMVAAPDQGTYVTALASALDAALQDLERLEKPVVVAVSGAVAGAGLAIMLACDLIVADRSTRFVSAYAGVGLTPDCGLSYQLPRAVGQQRALELLLTPRALDAEEAHDWGLLTEVTEDGGAEARADEIARHLADGPSFALGKARALVRQSWGNSRAQVGEQEAQIIGRAVQTTDAQRLLARFAR